ncbi:hypothetical protein [Butyrivibrio sp. AE2015]|uniref:hypothetical protein n=1 Tax=Butyrivibrio sp. AE2015 TaxID=1280663 RepID=UPI0003B42E5E|nr:hypothetical protein [Butyrivibrio sp. AE2015]
MSKRVMNEYCKGTYKMGDTFIIKVDHCQNGSWQGELVWANEKKSVRFRSTLEMLRLMDEAIKSGNSMIDMETAHIVS